MRKAKLTTGESILVLKTDFYLKKYHLIKFLAEKFICDNIPFDESLTKAKAKEIIQQSIKLYGLEGRIREHDMVCDSSVYDESTDEELEAVSFEDLGDYDKYRLCTIKATRWVEKQGYYKK